MTETTRAQEVAVLRHRWSQIMVGLGVVVLGVVLVAPAGASDAERDIASTGVDPVVAYLMSEYGLSQEQATERNAVADRVTSLQDDLEAAFGDDYGGIWIDQTRGGVVHVGVRPGQSRMAAALARQRDLTPSLVPVTRSLRDLRLVQTRLQTLVAQEPGLQVGGLDLASNRVVVRERAASARAASVSTAKERVLREFGGAVEPELDDTTMVPVGCRVAGPGNVWCDAPLRGGVGITGGTGRTCTAGFMVRSTSDLWPYVLTAGHCAVARSPWETRLANNAIRTVGPTHPGPVADARGDAMLIRILDPNFWTPRPWVFVTGDGSTTYDETYDIAASGSTTPGMPVCTTGRTDATECGTVTFPDVPGAYGNRVAEVKGGCIRLGDSGGPVYRGNVAYGVVHAGSYPPNTDPATTCSVRWYYQGVRGAMALLNVRLITTSNP